MYGWSGRILKVDLSKGKIVKEQLDKSLTEDFIGGRGINVKILYDSVNPSTDPLSPENVLIFGCGPLTGTLSPGSGRFNVTSISPLTGLLGDSNCGGWWAPELKYAGYDHIIFYGRSEKPVYLYINDEEVKLIDAKDLWGKNTVETQEIIKEEHADPEIQTVCIGPAGENMVRYACIRTGLKDSAGRTGMGAVMGSKNLKAIAVRGTGGVELAKPDEFEEHAIKMHNALVSHPLYKDFSTHGTPILSEILHSAGIMPVRNWQTTDFPDIDKISSETYLKKFVVKSKGCFSCPLHCNHYYMIREGKYSSETGEGPEYETINSLGPRCGVSDLDAIIHMGKLCDLYGIDSITMGNTLAFMMELYQREIISKEDLDGIQLKWGDTDAMIQLIEKTAKKEGVGQLLAEGPYRKAKKIGKETLNYVIQTKGLDYSSHENRAAKGYALSHAVSTRGGDHLRSIPTVAYWGQTGREYVKLIYGKEVKLDPRSYKNQAVAVIWYEHMYAACDNIGMCKYMTPWLGTAFGLTPKDMVTLLNLATGWEITVKELIRKCERTYNLERAFIVLRGVTRADDYPPPRFFKEPIPSGPAKGEILEKDKYNRMLDEYYQLRGWNKDGVPRKDKLAELGLDYVAKDLEKQGKL